MHGSGIAQLEIMAFANVAGRAQADDRHAGGNGRPDPACAVFNMRPGMKGPAQPKNSPTLSVALWVNGRSASAFSRSVPARTPNDYRFLGRSLLRLQSK